MYRRKSSGRVNAPAVTITISECVKQPEGTFVNTVGRVNKCEAIRNTRSGEYFVNFSLNEGSGVSVRVNLFHKQRDHLPELRAGDVLYLQGVKVTRFVMGGDQRVDQLVGSGTLEYIQWRDDATQPIARAGGASMLSALVQQRVATLLQGDSSLPGADVGADTTVVVGRSKYRPRLKIKDMTKEKRFQDVCCEVLQTYDHENYMELLVTDYTANPLLKYRGMESKFNGPYGFFTLNVLCYDQNHAFCRSRVTPGDMVLLSNLGSRVDKSDNLEGVLHGDRVYLDKVNVIKLRETQDVVQEIRQQKQIYLDKWEESQRKMRELNEQHGVEIMRDDVPETSRNPHVECLYDAPVSVMSGVLYRPLRSSDEGPRCLKVFGRPVDFLPMDVRDFCQPYCATCELFLSEKSQGVCTCGACATYHWRFMVLLEDHKNITLPVTFSGEHAQRLLNDPKLVPTDLHRDSAMTERLQIRLRLLWDGLESQVVDPPTPPDKVATRYCDMCIMEYHVGDMRRWLGFGVRLVEGEGEPESME